jgi:hypothetical protein
LLAFSYTFIEIEADRWHLLAISNLDEVVGDKNEIWL